MNRSTQLNVEGLEAREVPAVLSAFNAATGVLNVTITNDGPVQSARVDTNYLGQVRVNNVLVVGSNARLVDSGAVRSITVAGSDRGNVIDISAVDNRRFVNFAGTTVDARGGDDTIYGSQFKDTVYGGADRDTVYGNRGNDHIDGGAGDDIMNGGDDNDTLVGGPGVDRFFGGSGNDTALGVSRSLEFQNYVRLCETIRFA